MFIGFDASNAWNTNGRRRITQAKLNRCDQSISWPVGEFGLLGSVADNEYRNSASSKGYAETECIWEVTVKCDLINRVALDFSWRLKRVGKCRDLARCKMMMYFQLQLLPSRNLIQYILLCTTTKTSAVSSSSEENCYISFSHEYQSIAS